MRKCGYSLTACEVVFEQVYFMSVFGCMASFPNVSEPPRRIKRASFVRTEGRYYSPDNHRKAYRTFTVDVSTESRVSCYHVFCAAFVMCDSVVPRHSSFV